MSNSSSPAVRKCIGQLQYNNTILSTVYYSANSCSKNQMKASKQYFPVVPFCYET